MSSLSEMNEHKRLKLSKDAELIFRMESDETRAWLSDELPERPIIQWVEDTF